MAPLPGSAFSSPARMRRSVVFPEPDGPSRATSPPLGTRRSTPSRAVKDPNVFRMEVAVMLMGTKVGGCVRRIAGGSGGARPRMPPFDDALQHEGDDREERQ